MIAYIAGKINRIQGNYLVVVNNGIGYKVFVGGKILSQAKPGSQIELHVYHNLREDVSDLYGFFNLAELELFEKLISVSGVGPKTALGVFTAADADDIRAAIINQDSAILKSVSGIGAKTAERIILELKNKVGGLDGLSVKTYDDLADDRSALEALETLGYSSGQAREALKNVPADISGAAERVKQALKYLGR